MSRCADDTPCVAKFKLPTEFEFRHARSILSLMCRTFGRDVKMACSPYRMLCSHHTSPCVVGRALKRRHVCLQPLFAFHPTTSQVCTVSRTHCRASHPRRAEDLFLVDTCEGGPKSSSSSWAACRGVRNSGVAERSIWTVSRPVPLSHRTVAMLAMTCEWEMLARRWSRGAVTRI